MVALTVCPDGSRTPGPFTLQAGGRLVGPAAKVFPWKTFQEVYDWQAATRINPRLSRPLTGKARMLKAA